MAMQLLTKDGILISCSCSYHLERDTLLELLLKSSRHLDRSLQIVEEGHQGPDHPVHPAIPETAYLKAFFSRVLPN
jgi:23S rRNA (cytosine1962-C5)-methyltransferase